MELKLITVSAPFANAVKTCYVQSDLYNFLYDKNVLDEKEMILSTNAKKGDMLFVIIAMIFKKVKGGESILVNDIQWLPTAIVAAGKL